MAKNYRAKIVGSAPQTVQAEFAYADDTFVAVLSAATTTGTARVHMIWGDGSPSGALPNAPNGSVYVDYTNKLTWVKAGAPGSGNAGAWGQT